MRPTVETMNAIRAYNRERGISKCKWKAPKQAPFDPAAPIEPVSWSYAMTLAIQYHQRRQAEREIAQRLAQFEVDAIPF